MRVDTGQRHGSSLTQRLPGSSAFPGLSSTPSTDCRGMKANREDSGRGAALGHRHKPQSTATVHTHQDSHSLEREIARAAKDVGKSEPSYRASRNANGVPTVGAGYRGSSKVKLKTYHMTGTSTPRYPQAVEGGCLNHWCTRVHSSTKPRVGGTSQVSGSLGSKTSTATLWNIT